MAMMCGLTYNLYMVSNKYFTYPVAVGIQIQHATDLNFPAVTICNMSPVKAQADNANQTQSSTSRRRRKRSTSKYHVIYTVC
jgi:hypothetical protein